MQKNNLNILIFIGVLLIIIGVGIFIYPVISNYIYNQNVKKSKEDFKDIVINKEKDNGENLSNNLQELYEKLNIENKKLYENKQEELQDPFSFENSSIDISKYGLKDNIIGYISIPKLKLELPIILGANSSNMQKGAVHLTQTSYPIGGINTNSVIAAHRGYSKSEMFRNINKLEVGDEVNIVNFKEELIYTVSKIEIIEPTDIKKVLIQDGKDMITLITCHPYRINTHRYVVFCERK